MTRAPIYTWDIEAVSWDVPRCVVIVSDGGDVERFSGVGCLEAAVRFMDENRGTYIAHAGGIYDTLLASAVRPRPWQEIVMSGSAVLVAKDANLKLRDSYRWWLSGLRKVGEYLQRLDDERAARGEPRKAPPGAWLKKEVDRARIDDLTDAEALAYCESDCAILMEGVKQARAYLSVRGARPEWTSGGSALALLEVLEPAAWEALGKHSLTLEDARDGIDAVRGARVEHWAMGRVSGVYCYDFKSAYPSAYVDTPLPLGLAPMGARDKNTPGCVRLVRFRWPHRERVCPVLDQSTACGFGEITAWAVFEELELLREEGIRCEYLDGFRGASYVDVGGSFARTMYDEKERGSFFGKVFLNSLHGKFSENPTHEQWTSKYPKKHNGPAPVVVNGYWRSMIDSVDRRGKVPRHCQPLAAATILGRTRAKLFRVLRDVERAGGRVFYCDTDSVHCDLPPERMPVPLGSALGMLAPEGGPFEGIYLGPKMYALRDGAGKLKGACKGVPWAALSDGVLDRDVFRQARGAERGADLRFAMFEAALSDRAKVRKEGIASFLSGLKGQGWRASHVDRTIRPQPRQKAFGRGKNGWQYLTIQERIARDEE